jgi:tetratricopeptide (TPR) repeat protein
LAKIPDLKVIARTSSFAFKGKNEDLRVIGDALGATTVLEGSVRKSGERVRITAQLIDVADGTHLWSETYDRTITDIFAVQDDVAKAIIGALEIHVGAAPTRGRPTDNPEAYALFLKARVQANELDFESAEPILLEAVELDPNFAEAHELLAYSYWWLAGFTVEGAKGQLLMLESANRALAIDPTLTFAKTLQQSGSVGTFTWIDELDRLAQILREQPNYGPAFEALTFDLLESGYLSEGLEVTERWVEIDPLSAAAHTRLHEYLLSVGRKADAMAALQVALEIGSVQADVSMAFIDLVDGRDEDAIGRYEDYFHNRGYADVSWVRELITGGRDPANGQALLDRRIPEIVASMPTNLAFSMRQFLVVWYLPLGFLDRYAELTLENSISDLVWNDADNQIYTAMMFSNLGMTAHPVFLEALEAAGIVELWNDRGAPDRCEKVDGVWACK